MRRGWTNKANLQDGTDVTSCGSDMCIGFCQFVESSPLLGLSDGARAAAGVMCCSRWPFHIQSVVQAGSEHKRLDMSGNVNETAALA